MTCSKERVLTSILHKEPDRIPLDIGGTRVSGIHINAYKEYRKRLKLSEEKPEVLIRYLQLAKIHDDFKSLINTDVESVNPSTEKEDGEVYKDEEGTSYIDRWGIKWHMPMNGNYYDVWRNPLEKVESLKEIEEHKWPVDNSELILQNIIEDGKKIYFNNEKALFVGRTCPGIYEMMLVLRGYQQGLMDLAINPVIAEGIMDKILELKIRYYKAIIDKMQEAGIEYFILGESDDLGMQNGLMMSPQLYRDMIKPRHKKLFEFIKKYSKGRAYIELHCCGAITQIIGDLIESGVEILNPVQVSAQGMGDTNKLKKDFGNDIVFHGGGIDSQYTLPYGTPHEVREEVKRRIDDLADGGGFIFTPVHSIQHDVPYENFEAMLETFEKYSVY
jgi:uroporphyrinogen decarboxylase